jgi:REP element-mobilizing transposase RayT
MKHEAIELDATRRWVVDKTIREVVHHRTWSLFALNVRSTHVHAVVAATQPPERVMTDLKAWSTRRMIEAGVLGKGIRAWSLHGSTRWLNSDESLGGAIEYVTNGQGAMLEMREPLH